MDVNGDEFDRLEEIQLEETLRQVFSRAGRDSLPALERPRRVAAHPGDCRGAAAGSRRCALPGFATTFTVCRGHAHGPRRRARGAHVAAPEDAAVAVGLSGALTALAAEHPEQLDEALTRGSRGLLPDLETAGGGLEQLAKE